ncbi:hypothetical protein JTE90_004939 [Oedothorax gibbosus]|uniref:Uncharacterized protein n=1 Tax=Oedothorax gibbosus TaxID=931172 RepID=A0AAV6VAZ0_9ARAC|nr:hypothetical protein JTE90_004939 [Oedothorax gibbosus]
MDLSAKHDPCRIRRRALIHSIMDILPVLVPREWMKHKCAVGSHSPQTRDFACQATFSGEPSEPRERETVGRAAELGPAVVGELD